MRCADCPDLGDTGTRKRAVCCLREGRLHGNRAAQVIVDDPAGDDILGRASDRRDDNAARQMAALRDACPPGTPLHNRKARRRAAARFGARSLI